MPHHLFNSAESKFSHDLAYFFSDELKEVDDEFGLTTESFTQNWVLCRNTNWTSIEVTHAHHDATADNKWSCREAKFFCTEKRSNNYVSTGLHLTVGLHDNTVAQTIQHERLLCFSQTKFPWPTSMLQRCQW